MGRVLVLFDSESGNTRQMASLVAEGAGGVSRTDVRLRHIDEATPADIAWCDGLALGSPTNMGVVSWRMKRFWDDTARDLWGHVDGKIGCAFSSAGGIGGGAEIACLSLLVMLINFGFLVFGVTDYVAPGWTLHYGAVNSGAPHQEQEKNACRRLGERLAQWVAVAEGRRDMHPLAGKD